MSLFSYSTPLVPPHTPSDMTVTLHLDDTHPHRPAHREGWEGGGGLPAHVAPPDGTDTMTSSASTAAAVDVTADKLDCMMELIFGHVTRRYDAGQGPQVGEVGVVCACVRVPMCVCE